MEAPATRTGEPAGGFDAEHLAELAVQDLDVQPGQVIAIWASTHSLDLIQALAYRIRARGASWTLRLVMEGLLERIGLYLPEEHLANVPVHELRWLNDLDAIIDVRDHGAHVTGVSPGRRRAMAAEWISLIDEAGRLGVRWLKLINPTPALADAYGMPPDVFRHIVWRALAVDPASLAAAQTALRKRLERANEVHVTSALGTDLHLRIAGRPVFVDDQGLPRGEVYVAPLEETAEGLAVIDLAFLLDRRIEKLALRFEAGRLVEISAPDAAGADVLREVLAASSGDADRIGEFAIGLNENLDEPVGISALDEKIGGSVHIALGMNEAFGGTNRSNLHLDLVILKARVVLDGEELHT
jgi:aminopeptidase